MRTPRVTRSSLLTLALAGALVGCGGSTLARVRAHARAHGQGLARDAELVVEPRETVPLAGLSRYAVWELLPDAAGMQCFAWEAQVACSNDSTLLAQIVRSFRLGEQPEQLSDAEWIQLVRETQGLALVVGDPYLPQPPGVDDALFASLRPPTVHRRPGSLRVEIDFVRVAQPIGPLDLQHLSVEVDAANHVRVTVEPLSQIRDPNASVRRSTQMRGRVAA